MNSTIQLWWPFGASAREVARVLRLGAEAGCSGWVLRPAGCSDRLGAPTGWWRANT